MDMVLTYRNLIYFFNLQYYNYKQLSYLNGSLVSWFRLVVKAYYISVQNVSIKGHHKDLNQPLKFYKIFKHFKFLFLQYSCLLWLSKQFEPNNSQPQN